MRIKKKTSMMLLAVSTAAVVGVAAVSFAAWQGGDTLSASASTGTAYLQGFTNEEALTFNSKKLIPWDQGAGSYVEETNVKVLTDTLTYVAAGEYTISVTLTSNGAPNADYYVLIDNAEATGLPTNADGATVSPATDSHWKALADVNDTVTFSKTELGVTLGAGNAGTAYIHVAMVSSSADTDMTDKAFTFDIVYNSDAYVG